MEKNLYQERGNSVLSKEVETSYEPEIKQPSIFDKFSNIIIKVEEGTSGQMYWDFI